MDGNKVWYWVHFGFTVALAVLSAVSVVLLATDSNLPPVNSFGGVIIFVFVVPGTLLVFAINHLAAVAAEAAGDPHLRQGGDDHRRGAHPRRDGWRRSTRSSASARCSSSCR